MRLFVAVNPPAAACEHLGGTVSRMALGGPTPAGRSTGLIPADRWHLTLAFLGEVPDDRLTDATRAVGTAVGAWHRDRPPRLRLHGGGRFGRGRYTVLWVGVAGEVPALRSLSQGLARSLRQARLPVDRKPFRPHVTLARCGDRLTDEQVSADLDTLAGYAGPFWTVGSVELVSSVLGPRPAYRSERRWDLDA